MSYKLTYFGLPALAEPIRLLLVLGGMEWEDEIMTFDTWGEFKKTTKWGQLPVLVTPEGKKMSQSKAMLRYLGKKVVYDDKVLYSDEESFDIDEMIDTFEDVRQMLTPTFKIQDQAEKEAARVELISESGKMYELLMKIEEYSGDGYLVGNSLTIADIWAYMFLNLLRCGFFDGFPKDYLSKFPKLTNIIEKVAKIPKISEYVNTKESDYYTCFKAV